MERDSKPTLILKTISSPIFNQTGIVFSIHSFLSIISEPCLYKTMLPQSYRRNGRARNEGGLISKVKFGN